MSVQEFLAKDLSFWLGLASIGGNRRARPMESAHGRDSQLLRWQPPYPAGCRGDSLDRKTAPCARIDHRPGGLFAGGDVSRGQRRRAVFIVDHDKVESPNCNARLCTPSSIGESKATSATRQLKALNPDITITAINRKTGRGRIAEQARAAMPWWTRATTSSRVSPSTPRA